MITGEIWVTMKPEEAQLRYFYWKNHNYSHSCFKDTQTTVIRNLEIIRLTLISGNGR